MKPKIWERRVFSENGNDRNEFWVEGKCNGKNDVTVRPRCFCIKTGETHNLHFYPFFCLFGSN